MRSFLEEAVLNHLSGESDKAQELFHQFIVARARQIHESMRNGEDPMAEGFDEQITAENYYSEDLTDMEDDGAGADDFGPDEDAADLGGEDGAEMGGEDDGAAAGDLGDDLGDGLGDEEEDLDGAEGGDLEAKVDHIEAELQRLIDEFEAKMGGAEDDLDDAGNLDDDMAQDDGSAAADEANVGDDEFADMAESVTTELDKVNVSLVDGKEIGSGSSITQNRKSALPNHGVNDRGMKGKPVEIHAEEHKGFEREPSPSVAAMKKRRNTLDKSSAALSSVTPPVKTQDGKEGPTSGKTAAGSKNKSPVAK